MIRSLTEQDLKEAAALYAGQFSSRRQAEETLCALLSDPLHSCFLWKENGRCKALLVTHVFLNESGAGILEIEQLYTKPQFRNRKIGTLLADFCGQKARLEGMAAITVKPASPAALHLAEKLGFHPVQSQESPGDSLFIRSLKPDADSPLSGL